jgi:hypothetical protein
MIAIAIFDIIVVYISSLSKSKESDYWLRYSFILIFLFLAFRYDFGNDYKNYLEYFNTFEYIDLNSRWELGWQLLCFLFKPLGFFVMTAFLAGINCFIYYRFIKDYVSPAYYWLAVFIYVFNPGFMLLHSSAMRQSVAIAIFLFSLGYLYKKQIVRYVLCVLLASMFHSSAIILLPLYILFVIDWQISKIKAIIIFIIFVLFLISIQIFAPYLGEFIGTYFERYKDYQGGAELSSGLGFLYYIIIFIFVLIYSRFQKNHNELLFKIAIVSYYVIPLGFLIQLIGRVGMYMEPVMMAVIPIIFVCIKDKNVKSMFITSYIFMTLYSFYIFFNSEVWRDAFGIYHTIFSAPKIY